VTLFRCGRKENHEDHFHRPGSSVTTQQAPAATAERRTLAGETALVVGLAVGLAAARSVLDFAAEATAPGGLQAGSATLVGSLASGQPWIDLGLQVVFLVGLMLPALLAAHLAHRSAGSLAAIGLRRERWRLSLALGLAIAASIGGLGLAAYFVSRAAGFSVAVVPDALPHVWWGVPLPVLAACGNAALEEVVLVGYLQPAPRTVRMVSRPNGRSTLSRR
jgi:hypothetical protein